MKSSARDISRSSNFFYRRNENGFFGEGGVVMTTEEKKLAFLGGCFLDGEKRMDTKHLDGEGRVVEDVQPTTGPAVDRSVMWRRDVRGPGPGGSARGRAWRGGFSGLCESGSLQGARKPMAGGARCSGTALSVLS